MPLLIVGRPLIDAVALAALDAYWPSGAQAVRTDLRNAPVALRKSCADLLAAPRIEERIPVYVNLKEWSADRRWSAAEPPTHDELAAFVRRNVRDRLSDRSKAFFNEHFDRLRDRGDIFFMFDSFDEIPGVLDADEGSELLDKVSTVLVA